ncbi:MAG TPA: hypothetical protein VM053_10415 [Gemmatimonadaceae bacterium]|nr:hypothetical protein [Gemmatimonadaceae bacterium]
MNRTNTRRAAAYASFAALLSAMPFQFAKSQQTSSSSNVRYELFANSQAESYLRYLQTTGLVPLYPWSARSFSRRELGVLIPKDSVHPWASRFSEVSRTYWKLKYGVIQPSVATQYNSAFAYGMNDGALWAGRGVTASAQAGFYATLGPASLTVAPMAFRAENKGYEILSNGRTGNTAYADPVFSAGIDRPQRFGDTPYSQVDLGQTSLRVDMPFVSAGVSTANEAWGPAQELPLLLGNNAAGFPHIFAGTSEPLNIFIAKIHARAIWGELAQSDYSTVTGSQTYTSKAEPGTKRFATALVVIAEPRGITGLEIGGARFFHVIWPSSGIPRSYFTQIFEGFLKKNITPDRLTDPRFPEGSSQTGISSNEIVSVFARWVIPHGGFELHAEYGREDHSYDLRDLTQEPDHSRAYSLGARKVFNRDAESMTAGRFELMNFQLPQLSRYRGDGEFYVHGLIRQGHTQKGQMLGADVGVGTGAGSVMAVDHYTMSGSWTASWHRTVNREYGQYVDLGVISPRSIDVSHALGFEQTRLMGAFDVSWGLTLVRDFNRNFKSDVTNLNALAGVRYNIP